MNERIPRRGRIGGAPRRHANAAARIAGSLALTLLLGGMSAARAGPLMSLGASARAAVANDEMQVTLAAERDGAQLAESNEAVLTRLNAAIAEARTVPGVRARLGSIHTHPSYGRDGRPTGWRVRGEVVLESAEQRALAQLAGRLAERMQLAGVQFRLSETRRRQEEARLLTEAAAGFRKRAEDAARAFGFAAYEIREIVLDDASRPVPPRPVVSMRAAEMSAAAAPLPSEGGDSDVIVTVSGKVELTR